MRRVSSLLMSIPRMAPTGTPRSYLARWSRRLAILPCLGLALSVSPQVSQEPATIRFLVTEIPSKANVVCYVLSSYPTTIEKCEDLERPGEPHLPEQKSSQFINHKTPYGEYVAYAVVGVCKKDKDHRHCTPIEATQPQRVIVTKAGPE